MGAPETARRADYALSPKRTPLQHQNGHRRDAGKHRPNCSAPGCDAARGAPMRAARPATLHGRRMRPRPPLAASAGEFNNVYICWLLALDAASKIDHQRAFLKLYVSLCGTTNHQNAPATSAARFRAALHVLDGGTRKESFHRAGVRPCLAWRHQIASERDRRRHCRSNGACSAQRAKVRGLQSCSWRCLATGH